MNLFRTPLFVAGLGLGWAAVAAFSGENSAAAASTAAAPAAPVVTPGVTDGKVLFETVCAACHGTDGSGKPELKSPAIAGLPDWYAKHQIAGFREGRRGHNAQDAQAFMMAAIAKSLSGEQLEAVVAHTSKMKPAKPAALPADAAAANIAEGQLLFQERCMECHRYNGTGEIAFGSPPLIGQPSWYIREQIMKFKSGQRGTIKGDVNGSKMVLSSSFIEDEQMLTDIIAYIMTLNPEPEPVVKNDSPFESASR